MVSVTTANGFELDDSGQRVVVDPICRIEGHLRIEVNVDESVVRAMAGNGRRSISKRLTNSAAICCASAALPPLPKSMILFPAAIQSAI